MFRVNNKDTVVLVSLILTLNNFKPCSSVSVVNFEHVIAGWVIDTFSTFRDHNVDNFI